MLPSSSTVAVQKKKYVRPKCQHKAWKQNCTTCIPKLLCTHKIRKQHCTTCTPKLLCTHKVQKRNCTTCKGSRICECGVHKQYCKKHGGSQLCCSPFCETQANPKYVIIDKASGKKRKYCQHCYINIFPDQPASRNFKNKERAVCEFIKEEIGYLNPLFDKRLGACSKRRPDVFIDCLTHVIIVEIDEFQHRAYKRVDEIKRLKELHQDVALRPLVALRFNPDHYKITCKKFPGCFSARTGYLLDAQKKNWANRLFELGSKIKFYQDSSNVPHGITEDFLFFDHDFVRVPDEEIDETDEEEEEELSNETTFQHQHKKSRH